MTTSASDKPVDVERVVFSVADQNLRVGDYREALLDAFYGKRVRFRLAVFPMIPIFCGAVLVLQSGLNSLGLFCIGCGLALIALGRGFMEFWARNTRSLRRAYGTSTYAFSESGLVLESELGRAELPWKALLVAETRHFFVIRFAGAEPLALVPKCAATPAELSTFRRLVVGAERGSASLYKSAAAPA